MTYKESSRLFRSFKAALLGFRKAYPRIKMLIIQGGFFRQVNYYAGVCLIEANDNGER